MRRYIKSLFAIVLILSIVFNNSINIYAATFSLKASKTSVAPNSTVTVKVSIDGYGIFSVKGENATVSTNELHVDEVAEFSVKVGKEGKSKVVVTAIDATTFDIEPVTGSKSITITIVQPQTESNKETTTKKPSSSNNSTTTTNKKPSSTDKTTNKTDKETVKKEEVKKSNDNSLKSLTLSTGTLNPAFSKDVVEYNVTLPAGTSSLSLDAVANHKKAFIQGSGSYEVKEGKQKLKVVCQSESGKKKTYTINVEVEKPKVFVDYNDEKLEVISDIKDVKVPEYFTETNVQINNETVKGFKHKNAEKTILYLKDSQGNMNLYNYNNNNKVTSLFEYINVLGREYIIIDLLEDIRVQTGMSPNEIKIDNTSISGWTFDDVPFNNYSIAYLMNDQGEQGFYSYESTEGTIQKFNFSMFQLKKEKEAFDYELLLAGGNLLLVAVTMSFAYLYFYNKKASKERLLMYLKNKK